MVFSSIIAVYIISTTFYNFLIIFSLSKAIDLFAAF